MTFDSNSAWKQASALLMANREVLLGLAGVFFLLPSLALALFLPAPQAPAGIQPDEAMAMMQDFYAATLPFMIPVIVLQAIGSLAALTLFTDRARPTVAEAIRQGAVCLLPYILAHVLLGLGVGIAGGAVLGVLGLTGSKTLLAAGIITILVAMIYVMVRTALVAPVIAVEGERNPVAALKRSWALSAGNVRRIALFFLLVGVVFLVLVMVVSAIVGVTMTLLAGAEVAGTVNTVVSSAMGAAMTLTFIAMLAAVHRQLAGPSAQAVSQTFD